MSIIIPRSIKTQGQLENYIDPDNKDTHIILKSKRSFSFCALQPQAHNERIQNYVCNPPRLIKRQQKQVAVIIS
jgi:hypothetical protein